MVPANRNEPDSPPPGPPSGPPLEPPLDDRSEEVRRLLLPFLKEPQLPGLLEAVDALGAEGSPSFTSRLLAVRALVARAEQTPLDAPPDEMALSRAEKILATGSAPEFGDVNHEAWVRSSANVLRLQGRGDASENAFKEALSQYPESASLWADFSLLHKWNRSYEDVVRTADEALRWHEKMHKNGAPAPKRLHWNRAIAFTALGRGQEALDAWAELGLVGKLSDGGTPLLSGPLTTVEVRVPSIGSGHQGPIEDRAVGLEVVRVQLLSPCHGVVDTPTLRRAPVDYGDVILFDGSPISIREQNGKPLPMFAWLDTIRPGGEGRFRFIALAQEGPSDLEAIESEMPAGSRLIPLRHQLEMACPRCAAHGTLSRHDHLPEEEHRIIHGKLILEEGIDFGEAASYLDRAIKKNGRVKIAIPELYDRLGDAHRAGIEHKAYSGIERVGLKVVS